MWLLLAVVVLAMAVVVAIAPSTTTASASTFAYDVPTIARVGLHGSAVVDVASGQPSVAREGSASPAVEARGASTTPWLSLVATNTATRVPRVLDVGDVRLPGVPRGAVGTPVQTGKGLEYAIPRGTAELDPRVVSVRIMDPVTTGKCQYPQGYGNDIVTWPHLGWS